MKLWQKGYDIDKNVEKYTVGDDTILDQKLVKYDCEASIAHAKMLKKIGILSKIELDKLVFGLKEIVELDFQGKFKISRSSEDCHSAIENFLTKKYGSVGKKIHTCRSRNDQVLTALRLYEKNELNEIKKLLFGLESELKVAVKKYSNVQMPGYTHMQKAMPTTVKTWLGSFVFAIKDDFVILDSVFKLIDQSPLGSAAGLGVPVFNIDKKMTANLMGFSKVIENPIYCQMSRGKYEANIMNLLVQIMFDLNKLATDLILFNMKEFGYVELPVEFCTGSSIMPQKKNPDVLELMRAKYHIVVGEEMKVKGMIGNLMSGYNRDLQLTKEPLFNSIDIVKESLIIASMIISGMQINKEKCMKALDKEIYATEEAYKLVKKGIPFRDAYKKISKLNE